ncbi:polyprotein of retroviral origin, putative, partial [Ixodes scapularis]
SGYRYILTMICPATKFPEAVPLKELNSVGIVDGLLSVFSRVGFPAELQSDQGSVFTSALTTTFLQKCGIRIVHSSVRHPQSNSVEAWHSVLKRVLRALCYEHSRDWEACLPATMFALRSVPHETTGFSPAELVYGRSLRSPLRMLREAWEGRGEDPTVVEYVLGLLERLQCCRGLVERSMQAAQTRAKLYYDRTARQRTFSAGDKVMLLAASKKNKLDVQWEGPAEVLEKLSDTNYALKMQGKRKEVRIYHSNLMKPYHERQA